MKAAEVVVVGAGVVGASVAFHLAERGIETLVIDRDGPAAGSTARSGALIRAHYSTALEADLAWESLTDYFEPVPLARHREVEREAEALARFYR